MTTLSAQVTADIPELSDFQSRFPQYGPYAANDGNFIFDLIMNPLSFYKCKVATELGLPAVAGLAGNCYDAVERHNTIPFNDYLKQFIGALICTLMESNGYIKTGAKKSVPHHAFTKGEFYKISN